MGDRLVKRSYFFSRLKSISCGFLLQPRTDQIKSITHILKRICVSSYISLLWKPIHIPFAGTLDISNNEFETVKVKCSDSIKSNIEEDESPFEKGVDGISYAISAIQLQ